MDRLSEHQESLEEVSMVGGPWCGLTYQILKEDRTRSVDIPHEVSSGNCLYHRYERDHPDEELFYYRGAFET